MNIKELNTLFIKAVRIENTETAVMNFNKFFNQHIDFLYKAVLNSFRYDKTFNKVIEFYGAYEFIDKVKGIIQNKIREGNSPITFFQYFMQCVKYELLNKSRNKDFKQFDTLVLPGLDIYQNQDLLINTGYKFDSKDTRGQLLFKVSKLIEQLYECLAAGDNARCVYLVKYINRVITNYSQRMTYADVNFLQAQLNLFQANLFFEQGKLNISKKYVDEAINTLKDLTEYGTEFIQTSYNLLALIEINKGCFANGIKLFKDNIDAYSSKRISADKVPIVHLESKLLLSMFVGNERFSQGERLLNEVSESVVEEKHKLSQEIIYAKSYLYIDNDRFNKAIDIIADLDSTAIQYTVINKIRFYTAKCELLIASFNNHNQHDIVTSYEYLVTAKELNKKIDNKYFIAIHHILEGYILNNNSLILMGINLLKQGGYFYFYQWYYNKLKSLGYIK